MPMGSRRRLPGRAQGPHYGYGATASGRASKREGHDRSRDTTRQERGPASWGFGASLQRRAPNHGPRYLARNGLLLWSSERLRSRFGRDEELHWLDTQRLRDAPYRSERRRVPAPFEALHLRHAHIESVGEFLLRETSRLAQLRDASSHPLNEALWRVAHGVRDTRRLRVEL